MARVLAFDCSSVTGWASFADARAYPALGHFALPSGMNYGERNLGMLVRVRLLIDRHHPDIVAFEAPIFLPRDQWHTRRLLTGLVNMVELAAAERDLRCIEVDPSVVKRVMCGPRRRVGRKFKSASKEDMVAAAEGMGWKVANHHQADACGVAVATYGHLHRLSNGAPL
jgi:Holliday junction resolvasome RuvABC endonuclease subunit